MKYIDLFGGIGGFRYGIRKATESMGRLQQENKEKCGSGSNQNERELPDNRECNNRKWECERLQGYPDDWTKGVSDTQRYKQCGNSVTTKVIKAIVRSWRENERTLDNSDERRL